MPSRYPAALVEIAIQRALTSHRGQADKAGQPYILHPLRLMARLDDPLAQCVALLHDTLEDSSTSAADLLNDGFPVEVVRAVEALTRGRAESYEDFIERVLLNPLAREVKLMDLEDNMNVLRLRGVADSDLRRIAKYHRAWLRLHEYD